VTAAPPLCWPGPAMAAPPCRGDLRLGYSWNLCRINQWPIESGDCRLWTLRCQYFVVMSCACGLRPTCLELKFQVSSFNIGPYALGRRS